jgi:hypothetical protein
LLLAASPCFAEEVLGTWTSDEDAMRVKFDQCGDALCGNVVRVKPGSDVKTKVGRRLSTTCVATERGPGAAKPVNPASG